MEQNVSVQTPLTYAFLGNTSMVLSVSISKTLAPKELVGMEKCVFQAVIVQQDFTKMELLANLSPNAVYLQQLILMENAHLGLAVHLEATKQETLASLTINVKVIKFGALTLSNVSALKELDGLELNVWFVVLDKFGIFMRDALAEKGFSS